MEVPVNVIGAFVQAGLGVAVNDAITVSTFIVSVPRLKLVQPVSVNINFGI